MWKTKGRHPKVRKIKIMKIELTLMPQEKDDLQHAIWLETGEYLKMLKKREGEYISDMRKDEKNEIVKMIKSLDKAMAQLMNQPA